MDALHAQFYMAGTVQELEHQRIARIHAEMGELLFTRQNNAMITTLQTGMDVIKIA